MTTGIYQLRFDDGSIYVGQAENIEKRFKEHIAQLSKGNHTVKMQAAFASSGEYPTCKFLIECHRDYLDIFECFFIYQADRRLLLNSVFPNNVCEAMTQSTLDLLVEHKDRPVVTLLDTLSLYKIRVNGLKVSLEEAEEEIEKIDHTRTVEEIKAVANSKLKLKFDFLTEEHKLLQKRYSDLQNDYDELVDTFTKYKNRSFFSKLFG